MKLLYVSEFLNEDSRAAAFAVRSRALARELGRQGISVVLCTTEAPGTTPETKSVIRLLPPEFPRRPGSGLRRRLSATLPFIRSFATALHRERPDRVVISFHDPQYAFLAALASQLNSAPCVFDAQDSWLVMELEHRGAVRNVIRRTFERAAMRLATEVTTVSPTLRDMLVKEYELCADRVHVVYNAADPARSFPATSKDIDIIHLGSPRRYYNTLGLVDAIALLKQRGLLPKVVFLGYTPELYADAVRDHLAALGLTDLISFEQSVPPDTVPKWLARARVGVHTLIDHPVYRCAIGIKVFEYLASGLPVVHMGPRDGETARLIAASGCGITTVTVPELAEALRLVLTDTKTRTALVAGAQIAKMRHTWEKSAADMRKVVEIAGTRGGN